MIGKEVKGKAVLPCPCAVPAPLWAGVKQLHPFTQPDLFFHSAPLPPPLQLVYPPGRQESLSQGTGASLFTSCIYRFSGCAGRAGPTGPARAPHAPIPWLQRRERSGLRSAAAAAPQPRGGSVQEPCCSVCLCVCALCCSFQEAPRAAEAGKQRG